MKVKRKSLESYEAYQFNGVDRVDGVYQIKELGLTLLPGAALNTYNASSIGGKFNQKFIKIGDWFVRDADGSITAYMEEDFNHIFEQAAE